MAEDDSEVEDEGAQAPLVRRGALDAELGARLCPDFEKALHARAADCALACVVSVDADVEEQRQRAAGLCGERVALREPHAKVFACPAVEVRSERGFNGDHALRNDRAHEMGEALRDAAGWRAAEAEDALGGHVEVAVAQER
jgi:hypothetical protein